ncbi:MAG: hypothetical protein ACRD3R_00710, partial [Terriglobales bacterium]
MAYTIRTKDGIELAVDDDILPDDPLVKQAVQTERNKRAKATQQKRIESAQREERERFDREEAARPWVERAMTNLGAGMMELPQGIKQRLGHVSPEEVREKRDRDKRLAEGTAGGGLVQFGGEILPTMAVPAGAAVRGVSMAGKLLPKALTARLPAAGAVTDAALMGGATGALQPTLPEESPVANTAVGAVGGTVLPSLAAGGRLLHRTLTRKGAERRAAEAVATRGDTSAVERALKAQGADDIPLSTAATAGNYDLAMLERASRNRDPAAWTALDADTARGVWRNVDRATENMDDLAAHRRVRDTGYNANVDEMVRNVDPAVFKNEVSRFGALVDQAKMTPQGQNQMRGVLSEISRQLDEVGDHITPQHLAALRSRMAGSVKGTPLTDPFRSAPTSDPYYRSLRDELDAMLDRSSSGKWSPVNEAYAAASRPVTASRASQAIREGFES